MATFVAHSLAVVEVCVILHLAQVSFHLRVEKIAGAP